MTYQSTRIEKGSGIPGPNPMWSRPQAFGAALAGETAPPLGGFVAVLAGVYVVSPITETAANVCGAGGGELSADHSQVHARLDLARKRLNS